MDSLIEIIKEIRTLKSLHKISSSVDCVISTDNVELIKMIDNHYSIFCKLAGLNKIEWLI